MSMPKPLCHLHMAKTTLWAVSSWGFGRKPLPFHKLKNHNLHSLSSQQQTQGFPLSKVTSLCETSEEMFSKKDDNWLYEPTPSYEINILIQAINLVLLLLCFRQPYYDLCGRPCTQQATWHVQTWEKPWNAHPLPSLIDTRKEGKVRPRAMSTLTHRALRISDSNHLPAEWQF